MFRKSLKLKAFFIPLFISFSIFAVSCSANLPDIRTPEYTMIFEYESEDSHPDARLSVFAETLSSVRRSEEIILQSEEENFKWITDNVVMLAAEGRNMAGYTSFKLPKGMVFPECRYFFTYIDAAGEEILRTFSIRYDKNIYNMKPEAFTEYVKTNNFQKKIAIYDESDTLIYFGEFNNEFSTDEKIKRNYRSASYYYIIWNKRNNTVMCILPRKTLEEKKE